ncbi:MAG: pyridoxamine 5'-phosphate oxidase family protein [Pelagibacteraceae bacterium]|nr:pyridoxamine 5'-phosphate oxidase family protein [Pelagibacteraceae bacterium]MCI5079387.1 pyridoxamine 5'-phosphate oxidase family protein [Pelagibacteraceae bacterium]
MNDKVPDFYNNKDLIFNEIWTLLARGVVDRSEDFRLPVVIVNKGDFSDGRIVVLRGAFKDKQVLRFHTDLRSSKVDALKKNNNIYFLFYNKKRKIQVRAKGKATIHYKDQITDEAWKKTQVISRKCYLATNAPGSISENPNPGYPTELEGKNPKIEDTEIGFDNFCVIECKINEMEWLYLASQGHRRAKINIKANGEINTEWITP